MKSLWHKIKDNYNRIVINIIDFNKITRWVLIGLFVILYSPFILIEYFSEKIEEEVKNLILMSKENIKEKLSAYVKIELYKIASYVQVGRKYNDTKKIMVDKLVKHFT